MLDRKFLARFFDWLETASLDEMEAKTNELREKSAAFVEREARRDSAFLARHLNRALIERTLFGPVDPGAGGGVQPLDAG